MFLYYYATIPHPRSEAENAFLAALEGAQEQAQVAYRHGEELRAKLSTKDRGIAKTVRLTVGQPRRSAQETTVPVVWEATGARALFPRLEADLVLSSIGPNLTHVAFMGSYRPPLGPVGRWLDRALLHRVAEASVKRFLDALTAASLRREALSDA